MTLVNQFKPVASGYACVSGEMHTLYVHTRVHTRHAHAPTVPGIKWVAKIGPRLLYRSSRSLLRASILSFNYH